MDILSMRSDSMSTLRPPKGSTRDVIIILQTGEGNRGWSERSEWISTSPPIAFQKVAEDFSPMHLRIRIRARLIPARASGLG